MAAATATEYEWEHVGGQERQARQTRERARATVMMTSGSPGLMNRSITYSGCSAPQDADGQHRYPRGRGRDRQSTGGLIQGDPQG